jgi:hypothetical protein
MYLYWTTTIGLVCKHPAEPHKTKDVASPSSLYQLLKDLGMLIVPTNKTWKLTHHKFSLHSEHLQFSNIWKLYRLSNILGIMDQ